MNVCTIDPTTGRMIDYTPAELRALARATVKGRGKLTAFWVKHEGADLWLTAQYRQPDGWNGSESVRLSVPAAPDAA